MKIFLEIQRVLSSPTVEDRGSDHIVETCVNVEEEVVETTPVTVEDKNLGRGQRMKTKPTRLNDYMVYNARCSIDPSPLSPAPPNTASSSQGTVLYPISNYVSCDKFSGAHSAFLAAVTEGYIPKSYAEAVKDKRWRNAISGEVDALETKDTWFVTDLPPGKKAIGCRRVFTIKYKANGEIEIYKARLVAYGNKQ